MASRSVLNYCLCVALALLAAAVALPAQAAPPVAASPGPQCVPSNFAFPGTTSATGFAATSHLSRPGQVWVLPSEDEDLSPDGFLPAVPRRQGRTRAVWFEDDEESNGTIGPVNGMFDLPPAAVAKPARLLAAFRPDRATFPLRC